jgi:hypothetical protein
MCIHAGNIEIKILKFASQENCHALLATQSKIFQSCNKIFRRSNYSPIFQLCNKIFPRIKIILEKIVSVSCGENVTLHTKSFALKNMSFKRKEQKQNI